MPHWYLDDSGEPRFVDDAGNIQTDQPDTLGSSQPPAASGALERIAPTTDEAEATPEATPEEPPTIEMPAEDARVSGTGYKKGTTTERAHSKSSKKYNQKGVKKAVQDQEDYEQGVYTAAEEDKEKILGQANEAEELGEIAQGNIGDVQQVQAMANQRGLVREAKFQHDMAVEEAQANATAMEAAHNAKMQYLAQVQAYQAMNVNPSQLWGDMGGESRTQALAAVFVSDFLGAKGVKTSVMDTLNHAIDRSIDAQVANINKQGQVADHFRQLYNLTVQDSATEAESRARLRGFYYASMEKEIAADLAQYDAPMAQALTDKALSEMRLNFMKEVAIPVNDMIDRRALSQVATHLDLTRAVIQAQSEQSAIAERLKEAKMQSADTRYVADLSAMGKMAPVGPGEASIFDPESGSYIGDDIGGKEEAKVTRERLEGMRDLNSLVKRVKEWQQAHSNLFTTGSKTIDELKSSDPAAYDEIQGLYNAWLEKQALMFTGKVAAPGEIDRIKSVVPLKTWFANPKRAIAQYFVQSYTELQSLINSRVPNRTGDPLRTVKALYDEATGTLAGDDEKGPTPIEKELAAADDPKSSDRQYSPESVDPEAADAWEWDHSGDMVPSWAAHLVKMKTLAEDSMDPETIDDTAAMLRTYADRQYEKNTDASRERAAFVQKRLVPDMYARSEALRHPEEAENTEETPEPVEETVNVAH